MKPSACGKLGILLIAGFPQLAFSSTRSCPPYEHWVRTYHRRAYIRTDGTHVSASQVIAHCQKNPAAFEVWHDRLKNGVPPQWQLKQEKARTWTTGQKERVIEALSNLPPELLVSTLSGIYRLQKSIQFALNPASGHGSVIALYDQAFTRNQNLARILAHEFGHKLYRNLSIEDLRSYNSVAKWLSVRNPSTGEFMFIPNHDHFVEDDGKEGPDEDYSNNIEYFLFEPKALLKNNPDIYDWIHKKYGDKFKIAGGSSRK